MLSGKQPVFITLVWSWIYNRASIKECFLIGCCVVLRWPYADDRMLKPKNQLIGCLLMLCPQAPNCLWSCVRFLTQSGLRRTSQCCPLDRRQQPLRAFTLFSTILHLKWLGFPTMACCTGTRFHLCLTLIFSALFIETNLESKKYKYSFKIKSQDSAG